MTKLDGDAAFTLSGEPEPEVETELAWALGGRLAIEVDDCRNVGAAPFDAAADGLRRDGMQAILELRRDAEISTAAADSPEEVCVLVLAGATHFSIGAHDLGRNEVVTGESK